MKELLKIKQQIDHKLSILKKHFSEEELDKLVILESYMRLRKPKEEIFKEIQATQTKIQDRPKVQKKVSTTESNLISIQ